MAKSTKQQSRKILLIILIIFGVALIAGLVYVKHFSPMSPKPLTTTYTGKLPCADCSGLITNLTLITQKLHNKNGVYVLHELYEGKTTAPIVTTGKWIVTKGTPTNPEASVLNTIPNDNSGITYYLIDEQGQLTMLSQNKEKINSPFNEMLIATQKKKPTTTKPQLANPASVNCTKVGGTLTIKTRGDGGKYGLCQFEDNRACEEWALYRGTCPVGGVKTTGYDTIEQQYCAWVGGKTITAPNASCTLPKGNSCSDKALYNGTCQ